jgi:D-aspartate ligase
VNTKPDDHRAAAVIIGVDSMQGLQAARILRRRNVPVYALASDRRHHACSTNSCEQIEIVDTGSDALIAALLKLAANLSQKAVLYPCQDKSVRIISRHRARLEASYHVLLPPDETVCMLTDKDALHDFARSRQLRVPATYLLPTRSDALQVAEQMPYPCLLKPARRTHTWDQHTQKKVFLVHDRAEFLRRFDACRHWCDALVAQQWIQGGDDALYSCNVYYGKNGQPLASFVARKLRQWPIDAGSSCLGEEVRDDTVRAMTLALFADLNYTGLGYLEVKRDTGSGEYYIIEPNIGRPTGRSAIAEAGGVELLYTMYCDALDLPLPLNREQQYLGTKWIDLRHDLQSAYSYWRQGKLSIAEWLRSIRGRKAYAVFSWRDPKPFFADLANAAGSLLSRSRKPAPSALPTGYSR